MAGLEQEVAHQAIIAISQQSQIIGQVGIEIGAEETHRSGDDMLVCAGSAILDSRVMSVRRECGNFPRVFPSGTNVECPEF